MANGCLECLGSIGGSMDKLFATPIKSIRKKCLDVRVVSMKKYENALSLIVHYTHIEWDVDPIRLP